jgi:hypothetical protein
MSLFMEVWRLFWRTGLRRAAMSLADGTSMVVRPDAVNLDGVPLQIF